MCLKNNLKLLVISTAFNKIMSTTSEISCVEKETCLQMLKSQDVG